MYSEEVRENDVKKAQEKYEILLIGKDSFIKELRRRAERGEENLKIKKKNGY